MEEIKVLLENVDETMDRIVQHTRSVLSKIRAGKATPTMLEGIQVEYYGNRTPLSQVASLTTPDAQTISVKPWEKILIPKIETAIINSDLGLNPQNDGESIRINIPALTEERREILVRQVKKEIENGKISIRNARKETNDSLKKLEGEGISKDQIKDAEGDTQNLTDKHTAALDSMSIAKEKDIMTI